MSQVDFCKSEMVKRCEYVDPYNFNFCSLTMYLKVDRSVMLEIEHLKDVVCVRCRVYKQRTVISLIKAWYRAIGYCI